MCVFLCVYTHHIHIEAEHKVDEHTVEHEEPQHKDNEYVCMYVCMYVCYERELIIWDRHSHTCIHLLTFALIH